MMMTLTLLADVTCGRVPPMRVQGGTHRIHTMRMITYLIFVIFFTHAKFLENKIYIEIYTVNCQFNQ